MSAPIPISLKDAASRVLRGNVSVSALRAEAKRGNLETFRIGKNIYTTEEAVGEMIEKCRVQPSPQDSYTEEPTTDGSFETEAATSQPDALDLIGKALKNGSPLTSPRRKPRNQDAVVVPIKSR